MLAISRALPDLNAKFALAFLEKFPTPEDVISLSKRSFNSFVKKHRLREETREKLWEAKKACFTFMEPQERKVQSLLIRQVVSRIRELQKSLKEVESNMEELYGQSEGSQALSSIKGVGLLLGSTLLSQVFNEPSKKRDSAAIRTGAAPITSQSGKKRQRGKKQEQKKQVRMRKTVPGRLRRLSYLIGLQSIRNHDWAKAQYQAMRQRGKGAPCAFRAVARSMLRIMEAMLRNGTTYERDAYVQKLKEKDVPWAMELPAAL